MNKKNKIPVHSMDDWFSGIYIKPMGSSKSIKRTYDSSLPHRHDFYYCILMDKGSMELEVDFKNIKITNQSLFLSYPGQIHKIISAKPERGWFVAFDPALIDKSLRDILDQRLSEIILVPLSPDQSEIFLTSIGLLHGMHNNPSVLFRETILQSMLTSFIYQVCSTYISIEKFNLIRHSSRNIEITKTFKQLLRQNFKKLKKPSDYASKMNITVSYLNDTVRAVTGYPVTYFVQQELMREAERLLHYSELSVKEVAEEIGFDDARYFNRLFKKVVGTSPGTFKARNKMLINN